MDNEFIDIHSHILPGVDDGCAGMEDSLFVLRQMEQIGVTHLFLTPHYCKRRGHTASRQRIQEVYDDFCRIAADEGIAVNLHLGTEMEYSQDGARYIREGRVSTLGTNGYILVEFPPYIDSDTIVRWVKEICALGLVPVIAHIERYPSVVKNPGCVPALRKAGALVQVNIRSVCSFNLKLRRFLKWIFCNRYADFLGGDVHLCPIERKELNKCARYIVKHSNEEYLSMLMSENAKKLLLRQG